ncbi:MAG: hypothetical protein KBD43_14250, partial [Saprospiraceae bacterium]|nr:hypothetical protein [Saprospiraceae bacterium]
NVPSNSVKSYTHSYTSAGKYTTQVLLTDISTGPTKDTTGTFPCGEVTVKDRDVNLFIGSSGDTAQGVLYATKKGETFGLKWENNLSPKYNIATPGGYRCSKTINGLATNWNGGEWVGSVDPDTTNKVNGMNTANSDTGQFKFAIVCVSPDGSFPEKIASTTLKVISTTGGEI